MSDQKAGQTPASASTGQAQDSSPKKLTPKGQTGGSRVSPSLQKNASALQHAFTKHQVGQKLEARPEQNELINRGILRGDAQGTSSRIQAAQRKLQHHMTTDKLGHLLEKRVEADSLTQQNILAASNVAPAIAASSRALQKNLARANLYHALKHRPTVQELQQRGIYGETPYVESGGEGEDGFEGGDGDYLYQTQEEAEAAGQEEMKQGDPSFTSAPENSYSVQQHATGAPQSSGVSYPTGPSQQVENIDLSSTNGEVKGLGGSNAQASAYQRRSKNFHLTRILLKFVASMADAGEISLQQKGTLKDLIVDQDQAILAVAECFDAEHDLNDLKDSLIHLASSRQ